LITTGTVAHTLLPAAACHAESDRTFPTEAAAFFAQNSKPDSGPKAPSPFSVLVSAAIKGGDQKIFRHHDSSLSSEDIILLFDLLAGQIYSALINATRDE
jgi:hypothetical protein